MWRNAPVKLKQESPLLRKFNGALADMRHAYGRMVAGEVKDIGQLARGLLHPAIQRFEEVYIEMIQTEHRRMDEIARLRRALQRIEVTSDDEQSRIEATHALEGFGD